MGLDLRFGVITMQNYPWKDEFQRWKLIESLGFDSVWLADHFLDPTNPDGHWFEAWTLLAALAVVTEKIRIGTLVTSIPLRNPAVLARQALTVDHISNGRLELGIGSGVRGDIDPVYRMIGIEDWDPPERISRFREQIEIIDKLLRQRVSSYKGIYYELNDAIIEPRPVQKPRPPLTIAAMSKSMLQIAAQYADTWNSYGAQKWDTPADKMFDNTRKRNDLLDKYCEKLGRNPQTLRRSVLFYGQQVLSIFKSGDNFRKIVLRYQEIGITEFIFYYPFFKLEQVPIFKKIAKEVIPELR